MKKQNNTILWIIGIVILFLVFTQPNIFKKQETGMIGLTPHFYKDGVEVFPTRGLFSIVTPSGGTYDQTLSNVIIKETGEVFINQQKKDGVEVFPTKGLFSSVITGAGTYGVYDQISFDIYGSNDGGVNINMQIVNASPIAFKNALSTTTQILEANKHDKLLWNSTLMNTVDFESESPINFTVSVFGEGESTNKTIVSSTNLTIKPMIILSPIPDISMYAGETKAVDMTVCNNFNQPQEIFLFYDIIGNQYDLDGLEISFSENSILVPANSCKNFSLIISIAGNYRPDSWTLEILAGVEVEERTQTMSVGNVIDDGLYYPEYPELEQLPWLDVTNAKVGDDNYATITLIDNSDGKGTRYSHYLKATDFGFDIPVGAIINGIEVEVERKSTKVTTGFGGFAIMDLFEGIIKNGRIGDNIAEGGSWPYTEEYTSFGDNTELWGENWTTSNINYNNIGFTMLVINGPPDVGETIMGGEAFVDDIKMSIYYTVPNF